MPVYDAQYFSEKLDYLVNLVRQYDPKADRDLLARAFDFAKEMHGNVKRDSGEPYVMHPYYVVVILAEMEMDTTTLTAAFLHDCIEDTDVSYEQIAHEFGEDVASLVDGVTKITSIEYRSRSEQKAETLRKMFISMAKDIRVVLIKLADRLHNMRTLKFRDESKRVATAKETLDVYAPLAHRLGVYTIKWELEDLALRWLDPHAYYDLVDKVSMKRETREAFMNGIIGELRARMDAEGIRCDIEGRPKHFYSIHRKMKEQHRMFEQIFDLIAVRVIVENKNDCYTVLGVVHELWKPVPDRFKDYISIPKPNQYQSLHTTVINNKGLSFEVQIRTWEMHRVAEYGVAAHWKYKEGKSDATVHEEKLMWLRQILDVQSDIDSREFMSTLQHDVFSDDVFVFTPKGDVIDLPAGSTPLDFAYRIHSAIGNKCVGAKVNFRIVTLDTELKSGDFVEIITSPLSKGPSRDWLNVVNTSQARAKIKQWFKKEDKGENVTRGQEMLDAECKRQGMEPGNLFKPEFIDVLLRKYSLDTFDSLCSSVGYGAVSASQIITRLTEEYQKSRHIEITDEEAARKAIDQKHKKIVHVGGITVRGEPNMLIRFSRCCNPIRGDAIVGYITRGRGVSIHRADCANLKSLEEEGQRLIDVAWDIAAPSSSYTATANIIARDKKGLILKVSEAISGMDLTVVDFSYRRAKNHTVVITASLELKDTAQYDFMVNRIKRLPEVMDVYR